MITPSQIFRRFRHRRGFTLAEVIIASSVFTVVSLIGVVVFVDVMRIQRRVMLENAVYEDARSMMERIAREIRYNTIDYEEYYRADRSLGTDGPLKHGEEFGCYTQRFYNPGLGGDLGALCSDQPAPLGGGSVPDYPGCVVNKNTLDLNTGQNPYAGSGFGPTTANAFCDENYNSDDDCLITSSSSDVNLTQDQLFLINGAGTQKTYIGRKKVRTGPDEFAVALLRLTGQDTDTDGITETWYNEPAGTNYASFCNAGFDCPAASVVDLDANLAGPSELYEGFVPITPLRTDVTQLRFLLSPAEDPRKAFAETDPSELIQQQPHVIILLTVRPAESELQGFAGDAPEVTLQSTIATRVYNEVKGYLGKDAC